MQENERKQIAVDVMRLKEVERFNYLGVMVNSEEDMAKEI